MRFWWEIEVEVVYLMGMMKNRLSSVLIRNQQCLFFMLAMMISLDCKIHTMDLL